MKHLLLTMLFLGLTACASSATGGATAGGESTEGGEAPDEGGEAPDEGGDAPVDTAESPSTAPDRMPTPAPARRAPGARVTSSAEGGDEDGEAAFGMGGLGATGDESAD